MELVLGHIPSLEFWRSKRPYTHTRRLLTQREEPAGFRSSRDRQTDKPQPEDIERIIRIGLKPRATPVQLVVPQDTLRTRRKEVTCTVFDKRTPASAFIRVSDGVFVMSPELCLERIACEIPLINVIELGFEFCGAYRKPLDPKGKLVCDQPPLTSPAKLQAFAAQSQGLSGIRTLHKALPHMLAGSESPKESQLAMLSCLPGRLGGYGFPQASLNVAIPISKKARGQSVGQTCRCDLFWPDAKLDVEYDSKKFHSEIEKQQEDSARRTALAYKGILVISVTSEQLHTRSEMDKVANAMAKRLSRRLRPKAADWELRQIRLRSQILSDFDPLHQTWNGTIEGSRLNR